MTLEEVADLVAQIRETVDTAHWILTEDPHDARQRAGNSLRVAIDDLTAALDALGLCVCGKPVEHLDADEDSAEWACRVPLPVVPR